MQHDDVLYLGHILDCARQAQDLLRERERMGLVIEHLSEQSQFKADVRGARG